MQLTELKTAPAPGDMRALIEAVTGLGKPHKNPDADGRHYAIVPEGWAVRDLAVVECPERVRTTVKLRDAASFIAYFNDHKVTRSRVYASLEPAQFLAVFDDFSAATEAVTIGGSESVTAQADWRGFRAEFTVPASREWKLWTGANRKHMGQLAFAEFLQDNLPDVTEPAGADLLQLALNFEAAQTGHFIAAQRLQDGSHNLAWKADNNSSGTVKLPEQIALSIPVFENEPPRQLTARLRYRVAEGKLAIWFELVRPHKVLEAAFLETWQRIRTEAGAVILLGSPE